MQSKAFLDHCCEKLGSGQDIKSFVIAVPSVDRGNWG